MARELLEILNQLNMYNSLIADYKFYLEKTFDTLSSENYKIICNNLTNTENMVADMTERLAKRIENLQNIL